MSGRNKLLWQSLYLTEDFSDVTVKVISRKDGYTWMYPAHSLILGAGSKILKERMEVDQCEGEKKLLIFADLDPDSILLILRYLYFGELPTIRSEITLLQVLGTAQKLQIKDLQEECKIRVLKCIRVQNACHLLEIASNQISLGYGEQQIVEACQRVILNYGQIIFSSDLILSLSRENLEVVLKNNKLNVIDEITVFNGLWKWGKMSCCRIGAKLTTEQVTEHLGNLLKLIRYTAIPCKDKIPKTVQNFCAQRAEKNCCVTDSDTQKLGNRCSFRQPSDMFIHCTRIDLNTFTKGFNNNITYKDYHTQILCAQFSFDADVYLCAMSIEAYYDVSELTAEDALALSILDERTGKEIIRENVHWEETYQSSEANSESTRHSFLATVRVSKPIYIKQNHIFSVYLTRQARTMDKSDSHIWTLKSNYVCQRTVSVDLFLNATSHSNNFTSLTALYIIPVLNTI